MECLLKLHQMKKRNICAEKVQFKSREMRYDNPNP